MARTVAVVGGGVAGLVAARELARGGYAVVLLDAADRLGGALRSGVLDGVAVDVGAEAFAVTRPETSRLVEELELGPRVVRPRRSDAHLLLPDGLYDMPHAMLGVPTDLASHELRAILGAEAAEGAATLDAAPFLDPAPDVTLGRLVRDRMGDAVVERVLVPVVAGVHAADPDLVEAEAVVPGLVAAARDAGSLAGGAARLRSASGVPGSAIAGLDGGMTGLVTALADDLTARGVVVRLGTWVRSVRRDGEGWILTLPDGVMRADDLVVAVDAPTTAGILAGLPAIAEPLAQVAVGDVAVVAVVLEAPELDVDPVGSGLLIAPGHPRVRAKALTHATAKWGWIREAFGTGRHLVRLSYGRDGHIDEDPADLPAIARADIAAVFDLAEPRILDTRVVRWNRSLVHPAAGHRALVARIRAAAAGEPTLVVVGAGLGGNGLAGTIAVSRTVVAQLDSR